MAGLRCVNAFHGFMVLMLKDLHTQETPPREAAGNTAIDQAGGSR